MAEVHFEPSVVEGCTTAARAVAGNVSGVAKGFTVTDTTVAKSGQLASAEALGACTRAWSDQVATDSGDVSAMADNLHHAVQLYTATDDSNADRIRSAGRTRGD
jgi:hypothetical protein